MLASLKNEGYREKTVPEKLDVHSRKLPKFENTWKPKDPNARHENSNQHVTRILTCNKLAKYSWQGACQSFHMMQAFDPLNPDENARLVISKGKIMFN